MVTSIQAFLLGIECQHFSTDVHRNHVHIVEKTIMIYFNKTSFTYIISNTSPDGADEKFAIFEFLMVSARQFGS